MFCKTAPKHIFAIIFIHSPGSGAGLRVLEEQMSFVILTDSTVNQSIGVGEYGLIGRNATLASASGTAVMLSDNSSLTVAGTLFSNNVSVFSNALFGAFVTVTPSGSIIAAQAGAILGAILLMISAFTMRGSSSLTSRRSKCAMGRSF